MVFADLRVHPAADRRSSELLGRFNWHSRKYLECAMPPLSTPKAIINNLAKSESF